MKTRVILDEEGRFTIPESVRDELGLAPGGALEMESDGDVIVLRPVPDTPTLTKEQGVWVLNTGEPLPACADELPAQIRKEREKRISRADLSWVTKS
jgi:AbrB family looped-hinge helix DNA binding protein